MLKLYVDEEGAPVVRAAVDEASLLATSRLAFVEARAGLARRRRAGDLTSAEHRRLVEEFGADWERYVKIEITEPLVAEAADLADRHRLRAYDALHLASVLSLAARAAAPPTFCCWDGDLLAAASREGLSLLRAN